MSQRPETLGDRVYRLRNERGLTLRGLARAVKVSPAFMSDLEHGRRFPSDETLTRIARALGVKQATLAECRLTRSLSEFLERDPELLALLIRVREDRRVRDLILRAVRR